MLPVQNPGILHQELAHIGGHQQFSGSPRLVSILIMAYTPAYQLPGLSAVLRLVQGGGIVNTYPAALF